MTIPKMIIDRSDDVTFTRIGVKCQLELFEVDVRGVKFTVGLLDVIGPVENEFYLVDGNKEIKIGAFRRLNKSNKMTVLKTAFMSYMIGKGKLKVTGNY